jgi:hypothetical protein
MWRAFFMAVGIFSCFVGGECLVVDRFIMAGEAKPSPAQTFMMAPPKKREIVPAEAAPWTFLSLGSIAILYSLTLPKLGGGGGEGG